MSAAQEVQRSQAIIDVIRERQRQIEGEGFDAAHDDSYDSGELAAAAASYAWAASLDEGDREVLIAQPHSFLAWVLHRILWPSLWVSWWKPKDRRRDLVRAAALAIAAIEKIDRAAAGREAA